MPTNPIITYGAARVEPQQFDGDAPPRMAVNLKASTTYQPGTLIGEVTASPGTYGTYATGNSDGTQNPALVLEYGCVTDASGNVTLGTSGTQGQEWGQTRKYATAWRGGAFNVADLPNLDAGAVTALKARFLEGGVSGGLLFIPGS